MNTVVNSFNNHIVLDYHSLMLLVMLTSCLCLFLAANSNYELGRGDKVGGWQPKVVPSLENVRIVQIACGGYHSLALSGRSRIS